MEKMGSISGSQSVSRPQYSAMRESRSGYGLERDGNNGDMRVLKHDLGLDQTRNKRLLKLSSKSSSRHIDTYEYIGVQKTVSDLDKARKNGPSRNEDEPSSENGELGLGNADLDLERTSKKSPLKLSRRKSGKFDDELSYRAKASECSHPKRRHSKSPYKPPRNDTMYRNVSPFAKNEGHGHLSPHRPMPNLVTNGTIGSKRLENHQTDIVKDKRKAYDKSNEASNASEKSNHIHRSQSAPRPRYAHTEENEPIPRLKMRQADSRHTSSVEELGDMAANATISRAPSDGVIDIENTDSDSLGDIFFSKIYTSSKTELQNNDEETGGNHMPHQLNKESGNRGDNHRRNSSITVTTRTSMASNSSFNKQINDKISATNNSKLSGTSGSTVRLMANRRKSQGELCCSCLWSLIRGAKSLEKINEIEKTDFIEKSFVDGTLSKFWSDKHQPTSLDGFTYHKQAAQSLKQLVSHAMCPHILLKGPRGSGKKALTMALLCELFGKSALDISHELRYFHTKGNEPMQVVVPVTSSAHHFELNACKEPNIKHALISLVKEISSNFATAPEVSLAIERTDYKVIVLYDVDKATETIQHLIKWIMDCYTETCKLILCCEDDEGIIEPVKNRCKVVEIDAPVTREITEVLIHIAEKEMFDVPTSFAYKIAKKSSHNLRRTIMALEACKLQNYPFVDDQPIPLGWDEVVNDLAAEIISDPSETRIFSIRGKFQKLLVEFVPPKLILQGLAEQFLRVVEGRSKRELYYWHAYYEKRLATGTSTLVKLEEFVAKFLNIYRISESRG